MITTQLRTGATGLLVVSAVSNIITSTCEGPHIMQSPDQGFCKAREGLDLEKAVAHPVQMDNIWVNLPGSGRDDIWKPLR